MYNVPKRKRHTRQVPKVFLYSATILSVTTTNILPAASVLAEAQTPKKQDDKNVQPNNVLTNPSGTDQVTDEDQEVQAEQSPKPTATNKNNIYTILYKDENGKIINVDDNFQANPGDDISRIITNNIAKLSGNWELAENNATFIVPSSATEPIIVEMKPHYDFKSDSTDQTPAQSQEQEKNSNQQVKTFNDDSANIEEKSDSPKQEATNIKNHIKFIDQNGASIKARNGNSEVTVSGQPGTPIDINAGVAKGYKLANPHTYTITNNDDDDMFIVVTSENEVTNKVQFTINEQVIKTIDFSGTKGEPINIDEWIPSGYTVSEKPVFGEDQSTIRVDLALVADSSHVKNTIQLRDPLGNPLGQPFDVYGIVGQKINLGSFLPNGYELVDKNLAFYESTNTLDVIVSVGTKINNDVTFVDENNAVISQITITGELGDHQDISNLVPENYELVNSSDGYILLNQEEKNHTVRIQGKMVQNKVEYIDDATQTIISSHDIKGRYNNYFALDIPNHYILKNSTDAFKVGADNSTIKVPVIKDPNYVTNNIQFKMNNTDFGETVSVSGKLGEQIDLSSIMPSGYEIDGSAPLFAADGTSIAVNIKKITAENEDIDNTVTFKDQHGNIVSSPFTVTGKKGDSINLTSLIPVGYELVDAAPVFDDAITSHDVKVKLSVPTTATNYVQFTVNGKNHGDPIQVNGNIGSEINISSIMPSGYELDDKNNPPKIDPNEGTVINVAIKEIHEAPAPTTVDNTLIFVANGDTIATVTVNGNLGDTVNLTSLIPNGYELVDPATPTKLVANGTTQKVAVKKTAATNEDVTNTIKFKTADGTVIGSPITVIGKTGDVINLSSMIPAGYELVDLTAEHKIGVADATLEVEIKKISTEVDNYIQFTVNGADHGTAILVHGEPDSVINLADKIPAGYELVDPTTTVKIDATAGKVIKVAIKQTAPTTVDNTLVFVANDDTIATVTVNGQVDSNIDIASNLPAGYELADSSTTAKFGPAGTSHTIEVKATTAPTPTPIRVKNNVQFKLNGQNINSPIEVTGDKGENINLNVWIPTGYELESTPIYGEEGTTQTANLKKIDNPLLVENTIQFVTLTRSETNFGSSFKVYGINGESINFGIFMPHGYELIIADPKIDSTQPSRNIAIKPIGQTPTPSQVTNTVKITAPDGTVLAQQDFTGAKNSNQDISSLLPNNYEWVNAADSTVTLNDSNQPIIVQVQGKVYNNKIVFIDEDNSIQAGTQNISGRYNTTVTDALSVPTGYKLKDNNVASTLKIGENNAEIHVAVVKDENRVTNNIQFTFEGADFGTPVAVNGNLGDTVNLTSLIPNGYELVDPATPTKLVANGTTQKVALKKKVVATDVQNTINFKTADGTIVSTKSITGTTGDIINVATMIPAGYELVNNTVYRIGSANAVVNIEIKKTSTKVNNYLQFTVKGNDFGTLITVNGEPNSAVDVASKLPEGYELVDKNATIKINPTNGKILKVAIKGVTVKNTVKITINGTIIGTSSATGNRFEDIAIDPNLIPSGYKIAGTPKFGTDASSQTVELQKINDSSLIKNTIKVTYPDGTSKTIDVFGHKGEKIKLGALLPSGYTDPQAIFGDDGTNQDIKIKKDTAPVNTTNYVQFTVDGTNYGSKITVTGNVGTAINLNSILPSGYELVDKNTSVSMGVEGTTHKIAIQKIKSNTPTATTNYVQFIVNGTNVGNLHKVNGNVGDVINITDIIPSGYELANSPITIKFASEGTVHKVELKKSVAPNGETVENFIQFTIDGVDYSIRISRTGKLGDVIDITPWVPTGYELVDKNTPIKFQANGTVQKIAIKKSSTSPTTSVTNWVQLTVNGVNYGQVIKVTGNTGSAINLSSLVPTGYELANPNTTANFGNEGDIFKIAIKKSTSSATKSVQNYIQFTIDGVDYSVQIPRTGKLGDVIDITPWVPTGYELVDKNLTYRFVEDGTIQRIAIRKIADSNPSSSKPEYDKSVSDKSISDKSTTSTPSTPVTRTAADPGTTRKQAALPQTGDNRAQAAALSALGVTTAGTASMWLNSRRKRSKRTRGIQHSSK